MLKKILCMVLGSHKVTKGEFLDKSGNYIYHSKCTKCGCLFGVPSMTEKYKKKFKTPPMKKHTKS